MSGSLVDAWGGSMSPKRLRRVPKLDLYAVPFHLNSGRNASEWGRAVRTMHRLGLGVYQDKFTGIYVIGFANAKQHAHDRWLYQTTAYRSASGIWSWEVYGLGQEANPQAWGEVPVEGVNATARELPIGNMSDMLDNLEMSNADFQQDMGFPEINDVSSLRLKRLLRRQPQRYLAPAPAGLKANELDYVVCHELLWHWPQYQARKPEYQGMPRELVMRMHGLGPLLDTGMIKP